MTFFPLTISDVKDLTESGRPFVRFDQFDNIVQRYRDFQYAPMHIENFAADIGVKYNLWTKTSKNEYLYNLFYDDLDQEFSVSIEIPHIKRQALFPLLIKIWGPKGVYFTQIQEVAVQRILGTRTSVIGWRRIPTICKFVESEVGKASA